MAVSTICVGVLIVQQLIRSLLSSKLKLPFKEPQILCNRNHKALNRGSLSGVGFGASVMGPLFFGNFHI